MSSMSMTSAGASGRSFTLVPRPASRYFQREANSACWLSTMRVTVSSSAWDAGVKAAGTWTRVRFLP